MYIFIVEKASDSNINDKMKTGFDNFENCLNVYLDQLESDLSSVNDSKVTIYGSVTLENGAIMRATNSFHKRPWFSDISVHMNFEELLDYSSDKGICYGQVINYFIFCVKMLNICIRILHLIIILQILLIARIDIKEQDMTLNLALIR